MSTIVHFEIPSDDVERTKAFYEKLFAWTIEKMPGPMDYWAIKTTDKDGKPAVDGGLMKRQHPQQTAMNYIGVDSVDASAEKVKELGGQVVVEKMPVPGFGFFIVCLDTENNCFGLWEDDENAA